MNSKNHKTKKKPYLMCPHSTGLQSSNSVKAFRSWQQVLSLKHGLPMADATVYATALEENCRVVTSDTHFKGLKGVIFIE